MIRGQGVQFPLCVGEARGVVDIRGLEARGAQPVCVVRAVDAAVVVLPEDARALIGVGDRVILEGLFVIRLHGREQDAPAAGFEDAVEFAQRLAVVGDVFEQVVAEDDVDRIIGQRDLLYVEMQVGQRAFEVGRDILPRMSRKMGFQVAHDRCV